MNIAQLQYFFFHFFLRNNFNEAQAWSEITESLISVIRIYNSSWDTGIHNSLP